jgi:hypothetical protein
VEVLVAMGIGTLVVGATMMFLYTSGFTASGVTAQALCNQKAGYALEFLKSRAQLAVCVSNDSSGNTLTFGFDDDPTVDSDHDGIAYNDRDHFERFQFLGTNGTAIVSSTNSLVYLPDITRTNRRVLIASGVRNLPGYSIFTVTNLATTIVRFGVVDTYGRDHYQSIDIQATAVPLNRPAATNFIGILP